MKNRNSRPPRVVSVDDIRERLAVYEDRYGVPSDRLADAFTVGGELWETAEFLDWSALYAAWQVSI